MKSLTKAAMNEKMTQTEVRAFLGLSQHTFERFAERFDLPNERSGKKRLYNREDVERMKALLDDTVRIAILTIEKKTGKKVKLI